MRDMERKRAYDRERMAWLYDEGRTWWQQREEGRELYDMIRQTERHRRALLAVRELLPARLEAVRAEVEAARSELIEALGR